MKIPFKVETVFNKIFKPQIVTIVETFINDKPSKKFYGKSLTGNFLMVIYNHFANNIGASFAVPAAFWGSSLTSAGVNTAGANVNAATPKINIDGAAGAITKGIIVGTGSTAPAPADVNLVTTIAHGGGAGQLQYQVQTSTQGTQIAGQNTTFVLERLFVNAGGGLINVREIGLVWFSTPNTFLIYRDVLGAPDVLNTGNTYRVTLTFQITT